MMLRSVVVVFLVFVSNLCAASELSGFWQHPRDPVWLDVSEALGTGRAIRNDDDPSSVGFAVLREVVVGGKPGQWTGQVYASARRLQTGGNDLTKRQYLKMKVKMDLSPPRMDQSVLVPKPEHETTRGLTTSNVLSQI